MHIAKKYFSFGGLDGKKAGCERIRNAKNIHSSLLEHLNPPPTFRWMGLFVFFGSFCWDL